MTFDLIFRRNEAQQHLMGEDSSSKESPVASLMTMKYTLMLLEVEIKKEMCMGLVH